MNQHETKRLLTTSFSFSHAQSQNWTFLNSPMKLTNWFAHTETPDLAVGPNGTIHLSYWAADGSNDETWYATNKNNAFGNITNYQKIDDDIYTNFRHAAIALDANGYAHIIWTENVGTTHIFYTTNIGGFLGTNVVQISSTNKDPFGDIAIDNSGNVWIVFANLTGVFVVDNIGGAFNTPVQIIGTNGDELNPHIAANAYPHIVFEDGSGASKEIYYSKNIGAGWIAPIQVSPTGSSFECTEPTIAVDSSERPYIAYVYDWTITESYSFEIFYSFNLQTAYHITYDSYNESSPSIAVTSQGIVQIAFEKDIGGGNENIFLVNSTDGFQAQKQLTSNPYSDLDPKISIDGTDAIHVIWYGYDGSVWCIYYNYGTLSKAEQIPGFQSLFLLSTILGIIVLFRKKLDF